jgi:hypothetical protein
MSHAFLRRSPASRFAGISKELLTPRAPRNAEATEGADGGAELSFSGRQRLGWDRRRGRGVLGRRASVQRAPSPFFGTAVPKKVSDGLRGDDRCNRRPQSTRCTRCQKLFNDATRITRLGKERTPRAPRLSSNCSSQKTENLMYLRGSLLKSAVTLSRRVTRRRTSL